MIVALTVVIEGSRGTIVPLAEFYGGCVPQHPSPSDFFDRCVPNHVHVALPNKAGRETRESMEAMCADNTISLEKGRMIFN